MNNTCLRLQRAGGVTQTAYRSSPAILLAIATACGAVQPEASQLGSIEAAITVEGLTVSQVELAIVDEELDLDVTRTRVLDVSDPNATIAATEFGLPQGRYTVSLAATPVDTPSTPLDESAITCSGEVGGVLVTPGETTVVADLVLLCKLDGGQLQVAGGIRVEAEAKVEVAHSCGDLVDEFFVGPLQASVGSTVDILLTTTSPDVAVSLSATAGAISSDGYTCPSTAGRYTLSANLARPDGCRQRIQEEVRCTNGYSGTCGALPSQFALEGTCSFGAFPESPCAVEQNGCEFSIHCGGDAFGVTVNGEGQGDEFAFLLPNGAVCEGSLDGGFSGSCTEANGATCGFVANESPQVSPYCVQLPAQGLRELTDCGAEYSNCDVFQHGCDFQVTCDDGARHISGEVIGDGLEWWEVKNGFYYICEGDIDDAGLSAECNGWIGHPQALPECSLEADVIAKDVTSSCAEVLPDAGFKLSGCGLDGLCVASQSGCSWALNCDGDVKSGVTDASGAFTFAHEGRSCVAQVVDGELVGTCADDADSCSFAPVPVASPEGCLTIPSDTSSVGCGPSTECEIVQDGCRFQANCNGGKLIYQGTADQTGLSFAGLGGWDCRVDLNQSADAFWGTCTIAGPDGSVEQCFDLTPVQGAPLVMNW